MYNTDKFDLGYIDNIYNDLFFPIKFSTKNILEIGIWNGESIKYWRDLFPNANVYAVDINECKSLHNEHRVFHFIGNAYSNVINEKFDNNSLDIIIDDGPHTLDSFIYLIDNYLIKLKQGGYMIIEDIIDIKWTPILIDKLKSINIKNKYFVVDMRFKQKTEQLYYKWKNGLDVLVIERL